MLLEIFTCTLLVFSSHGSDLEEPAPGMRLRDVLPRGSEPTPAPLVERAALPTITLDPTAFLLAKVTYSF